MKLQFLTCIVLILGLASCVVSVDKEKQSATGEEADKDQTSQQEKPNSSYHDIITTESDASSPLLAVSDDEYLEIGEKIAYVNMKGDTILPYGKFSYYGTDTLKHFAYVISEPTSADSHSMLVGIDRAGNVLFDLYLFDNGPDYFKEGLTRVKRNDKVGYANEKGQIVIPCQYAYARWFQNGVAEVTFEGREVKDAAGHARIESDSWFKIDKEGNRVE